MVVYRPPNILINVWIANFLVYLTASLCFSINGSLYPPDIYFIVSGWVDGLWLFAFYLLYAFKPYLFYKFMKYALNLVVLAIVCSWAYMVYHTRDFFYLRNELIQYSMWEKNCNV